MFIKSYKQIVNNDNNFLICPSNVWISIIDIAFTSPDVSLVRVWEILENYFFLSDHKLIMIKGENIDTLGLKNSKVLWLNRILKIY